MQSPEPTFSARTSGYRKVVILNNLARSRVAVATLFFLLATLVRIYFVGTHPDFDNIFSVRGVPYSDGVVWVAPAMGLAEGHGLGHVFRPALSVLLALYYVWFGSSFQIIGPLHVLIGAVTAAFIYLVGERVFTRTIAAAATLFFVFDPSQLIQTPQATTEPLGLMFFVISVYCVLRVETSRDWKFALLAGAMLALSNLARPLTLICATFYAVYLGLNEWLRAKKLAKGLLPACAFCVGVALTLSPWLIRQRAVHGVWTISTNLGEALYAATSPKFKVWKDTVRAEADRAGIDRSLGARYRFFIGESLKNIQRNPGFYAGQVSRSYWDFINSFSLAARSDAQTFGYGQWTGLRESQVLFWLTLSALLCGATVQKWISSGPLAGGLVALCSIALLLVWHFTALHSGGFILLAGLALGLMRCPWRNITVLAGSLAMTGLGNAIFNNAILYRAVLMTDWIFSLFYLAAFYFGATLLADGLGFVLRKGSTSGDAASLPVGTAAASWVAKVEHTVLAVCKAAALLLAVFVFAGTIRLLLISYGGMNRDNAPALPLTKNEQQEIVSQLRGRFAEMREFLPDPQTAELEFIGIKEARATLAKIQKEAKEKTLPPPSPPPVLEFNRITRMVVWSEPLSPFLYYFPAGTEFELRDPLFRPRDFNCSMIRTSRGLAMFPGVLPRSLRDRPVVFVGWIAGVHPNGVRFGEVIQCVAVIPVLDHSGRLDYENATVVAPQAEIL